MTKEAIKMFKEGDFTPDAVKDLHISYETMFTQVPIVIKNSHLMNALMLEMQESLTLDVGGTQFLDLGTAHTLETELRAMMDAVDELNQVDSKEAAGKPGEIHARRGAAARRGSDEDVQD